MGIGVLQFGDRLIYKILIIDRYSGYQHSLLLSCIKNGTDYVENVDLRTLCGSYNPHLIRKSND